MKEDLTRLVPVPSPESINSGLSPCKAATLKKLLGLPSTKPGRDCGPVTNKRLKARMVTKDVGPFTVTGLDVAVKSLEGVMQDIKMSDPLAYEALGSAGMLCCRLVRNSDDTISNHSWGTAIDITFGGHVDAVADGKCQAGLLRVYKYFHRAGWFWGAEFSREDAMHFELADETVRKLLAG